MSVLKSKLIHLYWSNYLNMKIFILKKFLRTEPRQNIMVFISFNVQPFCWSQINQTGNACANKIVPDQTVSLDEQYDQGPFCSSFQLLAY